MVLDNTTLCAIVRDEEMNAAGGIEDFLDSTLPHLDSAVIVDTGSTDNTREILAGYAGPKVVVSHTKFHGFANARNKSLKLARKRFGTRYALTLDADERIKAQDFAELEMLMQKVFAVAYDFKLVAVDAIGEDPYGPFDGNIFHTKLFVNDGRHRFRKAVFEVLEVYGHHYGMNMMGELLGQHTVTLDIPIYHFVPSDDARESKKAWYNQVAGTTNEPGLAAKMFALTFDLIMGKRPLSLLPKQSSLPWFTASKQYNPLREKYR